MPSADPQSAEIVKAIVELDTSVQAAEEALVARDWVRIDALLSDQHRLTHALANALEASQDRRPQTFTDEVHRRLRLITGQRDDQLRRLIAFNHGVNERLAMIARSRPMRHVLGQGTPTPRLLDSRQ